MLKDKDNLLISQKECELISQACIDNASGNHLLRPRSQEYWEYRKVIHEALTAPNPTEKQQQIVEYMKQCEDYFYWKKLPEDKKLFVEVEDEVE